MNPRRLGFALAASVACAPAPPGEPSPATDAVPHDAGSDTPDASGVQSPPPPAPKVAVALPAAAPIPFTKADLRVVSRGAAMDYGGTLLEDTSRGRIAVVFERYLSQQELRGELRMARLEPDGTFGESERLALSKDAFVVGAHALVRSSDTFVYFQHGDATKETVRLARARFAGGAFDAAEDLTMGDRFTGNYAWPCPVEHGKNVALAYDHYGQSNRIAFGDGKAFNAGAEIGRGVQGRVASFASGALAYTWQNGDPANMIAYVRVRGDGAAWSAEAPITARTNIHDVSPLRRADGGVDLYFIAQTPEATFQIVRRPVEPSGALGPEQVVSTVEAGSLTQPHPHRLHDGSIGLVFAVQVTSNVDTDTAFVRLEGDAPK